MDELKNKIETLMQKLSLLDIEFREHEHDGIKTKQILPFNLFGNFPIQIPLETATIATTGNTDGYFIAPISGVITEIDFSGVDALAANDTNYITFSVTNLGRAGTGNTAILSSADSNTTKATGGTAISANTVRSLIISTAINATRIIAGDRIRIRAAATGTLANTVTFPAYLIHIK